MSRGPSCVTETRRSTAQGDQSPRRVLVCFAVQEEAKYLCAPHTLQCQVLLTGMGRQNAHRAVLQAIAPVPPRLVLTCGYAGGLNPHLEAGKVLFDVSGAPWLREALVHLGALETRFLNSERVLITAAEKKAAFESSGAGAVDMESETIRSICSGRAIPAATIRVISDAADEDLPMDFNRCVKVSGEFSYAKFLLELAHEPSRIWGLRRFQRRLDLASRRLATVLEGLLSSGDLG